MNVSPEAWLTGNCRDKGFVVNHIKIRPCQSMMAVMGKYEQVHHWFNSCSGNTMITLYM